MMVIKIKNYRNGQDKLCSDIELTLQKCILEKMVATL